MGVGLNNKLGRRIGRSFVSGSYILGRKVGWAINAVPIYVYLKAEEGLDWFDCYNPIHWAARGYHWIFGIDKITNAEAVKELAEKGMGVGAGYLATKLINIPTERIMPKKHKARRAGEAVFYAALANTANAAAKPDRFSERLENIAESFTSFEGIKDTGVNAFHTIDQFANTLYNPESTNVLYAASVALLGLALYRVSEIIKPNPLTRARNRFVEKKFGN